jgi:hypothetical protein
MKLKGITKNEKRRKSFLPMLTHFLFGKCSQKSKSLQRAIRFFLEAVIPAPSGNAPALPISVDL